MSPNPSGMTSNRNSQESWGADVTQTFLAFRLFLAFVASPLHDFGGEVFVEGFFDVERSFIGVFDPVAGGDDEVEGVERGIRNVSAARTGDG